jgi:hypothetical protein
MRDNNGSSTVMSYRCFLAGLLILLVLGISGCSATAPTLKEIWTKYAEAFKTYHRKLTEFSKQKWSRWKDAFEQQKDYQFARIKLKTKKFNYLLKHDRDRLITDRTIHDFTTLIWTKDDTRKFRKEVEGAAELVRRVKQERKKFNSYDWETIRQEFRSLPRDSEYMQIQRNFQDQLDALNPWLKRYNQARQ